MNQKQIGGIILIIGILVASLVYLIKIRDDKAITALIELNGGECFLEDGTCLHASRQNLFLFGGTLSGALIILAAYLIFFDQTQTALAKHQVLVANALKEANTRDNQAKEFNAFLSGFSNEEQDVLKMIHAQEGIKQSTLRYKTAMSKTGLSLILKNLEEKKIISRKKEGKTNQVFLVKKF